MPIEHNLIETNKVSLTKFIKYLNFVLVLLIKKICLYDTFIKKNIKVEIYTIVIEKNKRCPKIKRDDAKSILNI